MRDSFIFYASFFEGIEELDAKKRLIMYDSIVKFALKNEENEDLKGICKQLFALIKPQISANNKRYEDGKKGGRPAKKQDDKKTSGFFEKKPNENVNENENENENENNNPPIIPLNNGDKKKAEKKDPYMNNTRGKLSKIFKETTGKTCFVCKQDIDKAAALIEQFDDFWDTLPEVIRDTGQLDFEGYKPSLSWLLEEKNYTDLRNGVYKDKMVKTENLKELSLTELKKRGYSDEQIERLVLGG